MGNQCGTPNNVRCSLPPSGFLCVCLSLCVCVRVHPAFFDFFPLIRASHKTMSPRKKKSLWRNSSLCENPAARHELAFYALMSWEARVSNTNQSAGCAFVGRSAFSLHFEPVCLLLCVCLYVCMRYTCPPPPPPIICLDILIVPTHVWRWLQSEPRLSSGADHTFLPASHCYEIVIKRISRGIRSNVKECDHPHSAEMRKSRNIENHQQRR